MKATDFQVVKEARQLVIKRMETFNKMAKIKADREVLAQEPAQPARQIGVIRFDARQHPYAALTTCCDEHGEAWGPETPIYAAPQPAQPAVQEPVVIRYRFHSPSGPADGTRRIGDWKYIDASSRTHYKEALESADCVEYLSHCATQAQEPAQSEHESVNVDGVFPEWKPGDSDFKHWCYQHFGPDADEAYLAEAVLLLPRNQKLPLKAADEFELHRLLAEERYTVRQLSRALREEIEQPTFMGEPHPAQPARQEPAVQEPDQNTRIVKVTSQGVSFGDAWFSHERITGKSAACLNEGGSGVAARQYMKWLSTAQEPAPQAKRLTDEQMIDALQTVYPNRSTAWAVFGEHCDEYRAIEAAVLGEKP